MDPEASMYDLLERIMLNESEEPSKLPIRLLESITDNFSDDQKIGTGGFAHVYKGLLPNGIVAVKKLKPPSDEKFDVHETKFMKEVYSLMKVKHKNIVRFLGYCSDTQGIVQKHEQRNIMAEERQRFLCFEFLPEGSLDNHISDGSRGLEWRRRYQIIKGICEGLHYIHQNKIVHSDLKPANILLDHNMVPKIGDFGLARIFDEEQTHATTSNLLGSLGYMAPEVFTGLITFKSDMYSLGIVITEILTGQKRYLPIENVLESWSARFETSKEGTWLEHVRVCSEISFECMDFDPLKRPTTQHIIDTLGKLERTYGFIETDVSAKPMYSIGSCDLVTGKLLDVYPLELRFLPSEANKRMECPVTLTNRTQHHVGVWITPIYPNNTRSGSAIPFLWKHEDAGDLGSSLFCRLAPHSTKVVYMTMTMTMMGKQQQQQQPVHAINNGMLFKVAMIVMESEEALGDLESFVVYNIKMNKFEDPLTKRVKGGFGTDVHRATLRAVVTYDYDQARCQQDVEMTHQSIPCSELRWLVRCIDVHPTKTWVLMGHVQISLVSIWNYNTQRRVMQLTNEVDSPIYSTKFIARECWFAAGGTDGSVLVYDYATKAEIKKFQADHNGKRVNRLAVHPTDPLLLTASTYDQSIKVWDWGQGWTCTRVFDARAVYNPWYMAVHPRDTKTIPNDHGSDVKVWDIHSSDTIATFDRYWEEPTFYTASDKKFLVTSDPDDDHRNAKIWDLQTWYDPRLVHTLRMTRFDHVACHPTLPVLASLKELVESDQKHLFLWDARTYRLRKRVDFSMYGDVICIVFTCTEDLTRLVVAGIYGISVIKINMPMLLTGDGN